MISERRLPSINTWQEAARSQLGKESGIKAIAFDRVAKAFYYLPDNEKVALLQHTRNGLLAPNGEESAAFLDSLFGNKHSDLFIEELQANNLNHSNIPQLVLDTATAPLVKGMIKNPSRHRFQLGIILSSVTDEELLQRQIDVPAVKSSLDFSVRTDYEGQAGYSWGLCADSEKRLLYGMHEKSVMTIGEEQRPYLLLKFRGALTALCLQTSKTPNGMHFVEGNWYSPIGNATRDVLKEEFDKGASKSNLNKGEWALMRSVTGHKGIAKEQLIKKARDFAVTIPSHFRSEDIRTYDGQTMSRQVFRTKGICYAYV